MQWTCHPMATLKYIDSIRSFFKRRYKLNWDLAILQLDSCRCLIKYKIQNMSSRISLLVPIEIRKPSV